MPPGPIFRRILQAVLDAKLNGELKTKKDELDFVQDFINSFYYTYGYNPSIWEASAFDTANILLNLVKGNMPSRDMLRQRILALKDYPGVTGATSFDDKGNVDKVIFVLRVNGSHITEISP